MAGNETRGCPERPSWLGTWDGVGRHYDTKGNRCPLCGHDYPDYLTVKNSPFYGGADALVMGCRCRRCGLEFSEWWMLFEGTDSQKANLEYQSTDVPEQDMEANEAWAKVQGGSRRPQLVPDMEDEELMDSITEGLRKSLVDITKNKGE